MLLLRESAVIAYWVQYSENTTAIYHELWDGDGIVSVSDQLVSCKRHGLLQFRRNEQTRRAKQL